MERQHRKETDSRPVRIVVEPRTRHHTSLSFLWLGGEAGLDRRGVRISQRLFASVFVPHFEYRNNLGLDDSIRFV